jgi:hypothetical protein
MELRFWRDPETGLPHIYNRGVREEEVRQVLTRPVVNLPAERNARTILGQTPTGRCLKVVLVPDEGAASGFVVAAYELRGRGLKAFRRLRKRKRQ